MYIVYKSYIVQALRINLRYVSMYWTLKISYMIRHMYSNRYDRKELWISLWNFFKEKWHHTDLKFQISNGFIHVSDLFWELIDLNVLKQPSFLWLEWFECVCCLKTVAEHWAMPDLRDTRIHRILNLAKETLPMFQCFNVCIVIKVYESLDVVRCIARIHTHMYVWMWTYALKSILPKWNLLCA